MVGFYDKALVRDHVFYSEEIRAFKQFLNCSSLDHLRGDDHIFRADLIDRLHTNLVETRIGRFPNENLVISMIRYLQGSLHMLRYSDLTNTKRILWNDTDIHQSTLFRTFQLKRSRIVFFIEYRRNTNTIEATILNGQRLINDPHQR